MDLSPISLFHVGWIPAKITKEGESIGIKEANNFWYKSCGNMMRLKLDFKTWSRYDKLFEVILLHEGLFKEAEYAHLYDTRKKGEGFRKLDIFIPGLEWTITFKRFQKVSPVPLGRGTLFKMFLANQFEVDTSDEDYDITDVTYGVFDQINFKGLRERGDEVNFILPNYACSESHEFWGRIISPSGRATGELAAFHATGVNLKMKRKLYALKFKLGLSGKKFKVVEYFCRKTNKAFNKPYENGNEDEYLRLVKVEDIILKTDQRIAVHLQILGHDGRDLSDVFEFSLSREVVISNNNELIFENENQYMKIRRLKC